MTLLMSQYRSKKKHDMSQCEDQGDGRPLGVILLCGDPHLIQSGQVGQGRAPGTILTDY